MGKDELRVREVDRVAVQQLIDREYDSITGVILRLAWQLGLSRQEIRKLQWSQFLDDFSSVTVKGRTIPLEKSVALFFDSLSEGAIAQAVVVSSVRKAPVTDQYISVLATKGLQSVGLNDVKLSDLRSDYILMQMEKHPLDYVAQISNMQYFTLKTVYLPFLQAHQQREAVPSDGSPTITEEQIEAIIEQENGSTIGLILDLVWSTEIPVTAVPTLQWKQINLETGSIIVDGNTYRIPERLNKQMQKLRPSDTNVFLSARTRRPINAAYVSRMARELFVKNGLHGITLTQLQALRRKKHKAGEIGTIALNVTSLVKERGYVQLGDIIKALNVDVKTAHSCLAELEKSGVLRRYGARYYLEEGDHWSKEYSQRILGYLEMHPDRTRAEIETALEAPPRSAHTHLVQLMRNGEVKRDGMRYSKIQ